MEGNLFLANDLINTQKAQSPVQVGQTVFPGGSSGSYEESYAWGLLLFPQMILPKITPAR
jgi:hypothetical protein